MTPAELSLAIAAIQLGGQLGQLIQQNVSSLDLTDNQVQLLLDHTDADIVALGQAIQAAKNAKGL